MGIDKVSTSTVNAATAARASTQANAASETPAAAAPVGYAKGDIMEAGAAAKSTPPVPAGVPEFRWELAMDSIARGREYGAKWVSAGGPLDAKGPTFLKGLFGIGKPALSAEDKAFIAGLENLGFKTRFTTDNLDFGFCWKVQVKLS